VIAIIIHNDFKYGIKEKVYDKFNLFQ
jgi:hypothetical protein